jgi:hypothetical protein
MNDMCGIERLFRPFRALMCIVEIPLPRALPWAIILKPYGV